LYIERYYQHSKNTTHRMGKYIYIHIYIWKIFSIFHITNKGLRTRIYRKLLNSITNKRNLIRKWAKEGR
jgi:hypothetical protein